MSNLPAYKILDDVESTMSPYGSLYDRIDSLVPIEDIITYINSSTEQINGERIVTSELLHNDLSGRTEPDCHSIGAITNLQTTLTTLSGQISNNLAKITSAAHTLPTLADAMQLLKDALDYFYVAYPSVTKPADWDDWT